MADDNRLPAYLIDAAIPLRRRVDWLRSELRTRSADEAIRLFRDAMQVLGPDVHVLAHSVHVADERTLQLAVDILNAYLRILRRKREALLGEQVRRRRPRKRRE